MYVFRVPEENPELGETWELFDPIQGKASQAVVIELTEGSPNTAPIVRVMNRLGRRITVARSLFRLNWRFVHEAPNQACWYADRPERCQDKAFFRIQEADGWVWVCTRHIPAGRTVQFPFDRVEERALGTPEVIGCPACHTPTRRAATIDEETEVPVRVCGRCGTNWVRLDLEDSDGVQLVEQVVQAGEALHGRVRNIQAFVGFEAWTVVRRIIQPQVTIQGIPIRQNPVVGPRTVIVTGDSVYVQVPESTGREAPILPAVNSYWIQNRGGRVVEVQRVTIDQTTGGMVTFQVPDQDQPSTLPLRDFFRQFRVDTPKEDDVQILPHEPVPQERPLAGDTWWSWDTKKPVMILRIDTRDEGEGFVRFKGAGLPDMTVPVEDFIKEYQLEPPVPDCQPGEEWIDDTQSKVVRVREIDITRRRISVTNKSGALEHIPLATFASSFVRLERVSVYTRILDGEEDD